MQTLGLEEAFLRVALGIDQGRHAHWRGNGGREKLGRDAQISQDYAQESASWMETRIDLGVCCPSIISDAQEIRAFALACGEFLLLRRAMDPLVVSWGTGSPPLGLAMVQMLETGMFSLHVLESAEEVSLTLFSSVCMPPYATALFAQEWFEAQEVELAVAFRGDRPSGPRARLQAQVSREGAEAC